MTFRDRATFRPPAYPPTLFAAAALLLTACTARHKDEPGPHPAASAVTTRANAVAVDCGPPSFTAGVGRRDISPNLEAGPQYLAGMAARGPHPADRVGKPIEVSALAIGSEGRWPIVIVTLDLTQIDANFADDVRRQIRARPGMEMPGEQILFNVSHTHNAPLMIPASHFGHDYEHPDSAYVDAVKGQTVEAIVDALQSMSPATVAFGRTEHGAAAGVCRRDDCVGDDTLDLLRIADANNVTTAVAFFQAAHPVADAWYQDNPPIQSPHFYEVSPDFPGFARDAVERELSASGSVNPIALYVQGFAGDINENRNGANAGDSELVGNELAGNVMSLLHGDDRQLHCLQGPVSATHLFQDIPMEGGSLPMELQLLMIGNGQTGWRLAASSHEVLSGYAQPLRTFWKDSPYVSTAGYSNGVAHYFPTLPARVAYERNHDDYEGGAVAIWYDQPGPLSLDLEDRFFDGWTRLYGLEARPYARQTSFSGMTRASMIVREAEVDNIQIWQNEKGQLGGWPWASNGYLCPGCSGWSATNPSNVYFADLTGSGRKDLIVKKDDGFEIWKNAHGDQQNVWPFGDRWTMGQGWTSIEATDVYFADIDGDGKADLIRKDGDLLECYYNLDGGHTFQSPPSVIGRGWAGTHGFMIYFADMTDKRRADLIKKEDDGFRIWINVAGQTRGAFPWDGGRPCDGCADWGSVSPRAVYFADIDGDGKADLVAKKGDKLMYFRNDKGAGNHFWQPPGSPEGIIIGQGFSIRRDDDVYLP